MKEYDAVVIGGGPAGMMAAATAAAGGQKTLLIEKMERPGRKLRITGKGRCNLTNTRMGDEFLEKVRANPEFFRSSLSFFSTKSTVQFFEKNGVKLVTERGDRVFPASGKAWDISDALVNFCKKTDVEILCNTRVIRIDTEKKAVESVVVKNKRGVSERIFAKNVILATGGMSYPATGSTGDGYQLAHDLGHSIVEVRPSLVPLEIEPAMTPRLAGLGLRNINLTLLVDGQPVVAEFGEMDFSERGMEGALILRISRQAVDALIEEKSVEVSIDLKPALDTEQLQARIVREREEFSEEATVKDLLSKLTLQKILPLVVTQADVELTLPLLQLEPEQVDRLIAALKDVRLKVTDYRPFTEAVVTAGGIDVSQVDPRTLQSKQVAGLYFAGEVLDIDADTGGYNIQIALSTGRVAGRLYK
ncbi:MAG: NAD(P)/FAD-dependent oxidoreductase [Rikenellaceae bacterium]|jgi:predicted Rossmann fold flavoprotein|nr:NAD(P)/FAD-dependent oxidoreductase [Rikenellaceae bacterium]